MTHADLIDLLKAGSGTDRELDAEIAVILRVPHPDSPDWVDKNFPEWRATPGGHVETVHSDGTGGPHWRPQPFTNSLDACIGLMREVLPGWDGQFYFDDSGFEVTLWTGKLENYTQIEHSDFCRAILIAILQAVGEKG